MTDKIEVDIKEIISKIISKIHHQLFRKICLNHLNSENMKKNYNLTNLPKELDHLSFSIRKIIEKTLNHYNKKETIEKFIKDYIEKERIFIEDSVKEVSNYIPIEENRIYNILTDEISDIFFDLRHFIYGLKRNTRLNIIQKRSNNKAKMNRMIISFRRSNERYLKRLNNYFYLCDQSNKRIG